MNILNSILLQAEASQGGGMSGFIMIIAMVVIFYFFMIRPQSKKQKELKKAREAMKKGDKVVTAGGIHGRIKEINDTIIFLEVAPGVNIKVDKASVFATAAPATSAKEKENKGKDSDKKSDSPASDDGAALNEAAGKITKEN